MFGAAGRRRETQRTWWTPSCRLSATCLQTVFLPMPGSPVSRSMSRRPAQVIGAAHSARRGPAPASPTSRASIAAPILFSCWPAFTNCRHSGASRRPVRIGDHRPLSPFREHRAPGCGVRSRYEWQARSILRHPECADGWRRDPARISVHGERSGCARPAIDTMAGEPACAPACRNVQRRGAAPVARESSRSLPCDFPPTCRQAPATQPRIRTTRLPRSGEDRLHGHRAPRRSWRSGPAPRHRC